MGRSARLRRPSCSVCLNILLLSLVAGMYAVGAHHWRKPLRICWRGPIREHLTGAADSVGTKAEWASPLQFLQACEDLDGPFPDDHASGLSPLFGNGAAGSPLDANLITDALRAYASWRGAGIRSGARAGTLPCLRYNVDKPAPVKKKPLRIGEESSRKDGVFADRP
jgi:hypothetical protein